VKFFLDNNLAPRHAKALHAIFEGEHQISHLRDQFAENAKDEDWLPKLIEQKDWIVISGDFRIFKNPHQRAIWENSSLVVFFLAKAWASLPLLEKHAKLSRYFPDIVEVAKKAKGGTGFEVKINGGIHELY
jgi:hypothetical protein